MFGIKTGLKKIVKEKFGVGDGPMNVRIYPVFYQCNHNCPMCWRNDLSDLDKEKIKNQENDLNLNEYINIIEKLPKTVRFVEVVGGGEPLLFEGISEIFRSIKKKKFTGGIITNGSLLNKNIAKEMVLVSWDIVRISLNAASAGAYKKVNGVDDFKNVIQNIKDLIKLRGKNKKPEIVLHFVIQKNNYKEINLFVDLAQKLGVDGVSFAYVNCSESYAPKDRKSTLMNEAEIKDANKLLKLSLKKILIKNNILEILDFYNNHPRWNKNISKEKYFSERTCPVVKNDLYIFSNGDVVPCCLMFNIDPRYNIRNLNIKSIWRNYSDFRKRIMSGKYHPWCLEICDSKLDEK